MFMIQESVREKRNKNKNKRKKKNWSKMPHASMRRNHAFAEENNNNNKKCAEDGVHGGGVTWGRL